MLVVACDQRLWRPLGDTGFEQQRVDRIAQQLPLEEWKRISVGAGAKGERMYDWALLQLTNQDGWEKALLVRRSIDDTTEYAYYLTYAPQRKSTLKRLALPGGQGRMRTGSLRGSPLAGMVSAHHLGHAGSRSACRTAITR